MTDTAKKIIEMSDRIIARDHETLTMQIDALEEELQKVKYKHKGTGDGGGWFRRMLRSMRLFGINRE